VSNTEVHEQDKLFGEALKAALKEAGMTMKELAAALGKEPVTVYKICSGQRRFSGDVDELAQILGTDAKPLKKLRRDRSPVTETLRQARRNAANVREVERRAEQLAADDEERREDLVKARDHIRDDFMDPFLRDVGRVDGLAAGLNEALNPDGSDAETADPLDLDERIFATAMGRMADAVGDAAGGAAIGAAGGATVGGTAAFALFAGAASFGTASTGAAISGLSGAAASSATLAALGGGTLAAGGAGVAGGTLVLTSVVAAPVVVGLGVGTLIADRHVYRKMIQEAESLDSAEIKLRRIEKELRQSWKWARSQTLLLDEIHRSAVPRVVRLHHELPPGDDLRIPWAKLGSGQEDVRYLLRLLTLASTVLAMPTWIPELGDWSRGAREQVSARYEALASEIQVARDATMP